MSFVEVDKAGLAKILARRGPEFVIYELLQNAFDEDGVTLVSLSTVNLGRGWVRVIVEDNAPAGFANLAHAYTLFAESYKKDHVQKRGRYNMGDKLVVALCRRASITTTTGSVLWDGERRTHGRNKTERGSVFLGELPASVADEHKMLAAARAVICPAHIELVVNGDTVAHRPPLKLVSGVNLPTEIGEDLRRTRRNTSLAIHAVEPGGSARIYEMGIPVVEIDCAWSVDIGQKVPLNMDRDNVTPAFLREVRAKVLNAMHEELPAEHAAAAWVSEALGSDDIKPDAVKAVIVARHGDKAVIADPSDPEANGLSVSRGFQVVHGGSYSQAQWENIRDAKALLPAGQVNPSPKPWSDDPNAPTAERVYESDWSRAMGEVARYVADMAMRLCRVQLEVEFYNTGNAFSAAYARKGPSRGVFQFNLKRLGRQWFETALGTRFDVLNELLIHELGHHFSSDHLSAEFHDALCQLGAKLTRIALEEPEVIQQHRK